MASRCETRTALSSSSSSSNAQHHQQQQPIPEFEDWDSSIDDDDENNTMPDDDDDSPNSSLINDNEDSSSSPSSTSYICAPFPPEDHLQKVREEASSYSTAPTEESISSYSVTPSDDADFETSEEQESNVAFTILRCNYLMVTLAVMLADGLQGTWCVLVLK